MNNNIQLANKKDYFLVAIIGFLFGLLTIPILKNLKLTFLEINFLNILFIVIFFIVFAVLALWIAAFLGRKIPFLFQFAKFGAVGALNTFLDLGILNFLIFFSGIITSHFYAISIGLSFAYFYAIFKGLSFILANISGYFWNKHWVFQSKVSASSGYSQFLLVSIIGLIINVAVAFFVFNFISSFFVSFSKELWANIGALSATVISLIWNFVGYKFFVFKK